MNNISLAVFSVLAQSAAGIYVVSQLINMGKDKFMDKEKNEFRVVVVAFVVGLAGLVFSFAHLQYPLNAIHAFGNLKTSWMSREILSMSLMLLSYLMIIFAYRRRPTANRIIVLLRILGFVFSVILLFSMIRVYSLTGMTRYGSFEVTLSFICTTLFGGTSLLAIIRMKNRTVVANLLFAGSLSLTIGFLNYLIYTVDAEHHSYMILATAIIYILAFISLIPALIPRFKNIFMFSAVSYMILGLLAELLNRMFLLSLTNYNI